MKTGMRMFGAVALVGTIIVSMQRAPDRTMSAPVPTHRSVFYYEGQFSRALADARRTPARPMHGARAIVVPHHWLAGRLIMQMLRDTAATCTWRRVILIGPNHPDAGRARVITSRFSWRTPFGPVHPDTSAIDSLVAHRVAVLEPGVLTTEHSVAGLMPALRVMLPDAHVVPLIVRSRPAAADVHRLARALVPLMEPGTLLVASVDFSHYLSAAEGRARNVETIAALRALDTDRILRFGNEYLDSPATIATVIEMMRSLRATTFALRDDTDSSAFGGGAQAPTTSYVTGFYR